MCGILGHFSFGDSRPDVELWRSLVNVLGHRGPDDSTFWHDGRFAFGHRRLSIIDLSLGHQPMATDDGALVVTFNGEIYNYVELREDLLRRGHTLRTSGDTEVIVHLYEEHGDRFVEHLRGMFAISLWDAVRRRLVLARDRLGKKPIYWVLRDGRLGWGSELKALLPG